MEVDQCHLNKAKWATFLVHTYKCQELSQVQRVLRDLLIKILVTHEHGQIRMERLIGLEAGPSGTDSTYLI